MPLKLLKGRVCYYWSIVDTGWFELDPRKTIFVGPNEAGKTAVLVGLASLNQGIERSFDPLREFPRHLYKRLAAGELPADKTPIARGVFEINDDVREQLRQISPEYATAKTVTVARYWDRSRRYSIDAGWPRPPTWSNIRAAVATLAADLSTDQAELKSAQQTFAATFAEDTELSTIRTPVAPWLVMPTSLLELSGGNIVS